MSAPYGFQVYPHSAVGGETVKWNGVVYDLRKTQEVNGRKLYSFLKLVPAHDSIEAVRLAATKIILDLVRKG
jgi:hypothetical protein